MTAGLGLFHINHAYGPVQAVRGLSLEVHAGELVALLGPSGCGKSTVLRLAAGLETVQAGRVVIDGVTVAEPGFDLPPEQRSVGLMFQDFALFPHLSALDNVAFGLSHLARDERRRTALAALERVGLASLAGAFPHRLSGGEQQRVALARALAPRPKVMLLDEPFSELDVVLRDHVREATEEVLRQAGTPTLVVSHDPEEAMLMADRIALMKDGRILQEGTPDSLYRHPESAFCASFLGETNRIEAPVSGGAVDTPVGRFSAPGLAEGEIAAVLVRPEALSLDTGNGVAARVGEVRSLGRSGLVTVRLEGGEALTARVSWSALPRPGEPVSVSADGAMVFVFPAADR
jgi:iron(III) transport system ATP-binding protein